VLNSSSNFWTTPRAGFFLSRQQRYYGYREIFSSTLMTINSSLLCLSQDWTSPRIQSASLASELPHLHRSLPAAAGVAPHRTPPSQPPQQSKLCRLSPLQGTPAPERRGISARLPCREPEGNAPLSQVRQGTPLSFPTAIAA
jgi:hypothetical protein